METFQSNFVNESSNLKSHQSQVNVIKFESNAVQRVTTDGNSINTNDHVTLAAINQKGVRVHSIQLDGKKLDASPRVSTGVKHAYEHGRKGFTDSH